MDLESVLAGATLAALGPAAAAYALAAVGLNLHYGYTGLLNFGQAGFMLLGAYGVAVTVALWQWPLAVGVIVSILLAVCFALLLGIPALKLRADYLAISTIAAAEMIRVLIRSEPATNLTGGVYGIPSQVTHSRGFTDPLLSLNPIRPGTYGIWIFEMRHTTLWLAALTWAVTVVAALWIVYLGRSPWGLVLRAIREDEDAAAALGHDVLRYKLQSLIVGGVMGAIGGAFLVLDLGAVTPDIFLPQMTFFAFAIVIIGGAGSAFGPVVGSIVFWFVVAGLDRVLRDVMSMSGSSAGAIRFILVGLALGLLITFRPSGLLGDRRTTALRGRV